MTFEHSLETLHPLCSEALALFIGTFRHPDYEVRGGIIVEKAFLKFGGIFIRFDLVRQRFCLPQPALIGVKWIEVFHNEHIIHRNLHNKAAGELDGVERVVGIGCHLHPMGRNGPKLRRAPKGIKLHDKVPLTFELEVYLLEPPESCAGHFVEGIRMLPETEEGMGGDLLFFSFIVHPEQLPLGK